MPGNKKLQHSHKLKIVDLYDKGWRTFAIKKELQKENVLVSWVSVKNVIDKYIKGDFRPCETLRGKPSHFIALTASDLDLIRSTLEQDCNSSAKDIQRVLSEQGTCASLNTIRKAIDAAGFTASKPRYCQLIKEKNKNDRVEFCSTLVEANDSFEDALFSDECTIQLHDNKTVAYRKKNSIAPNHCRPKHPLKIHLWGAISKKGPSDLIVFDGIMDSEFYVESVLRTGLLPFIQNFFPSGHRFIQDNDPKHRSKRAKTFMEENGINWFSTWPSGKYLFYIRKSLTVSD